jgi:hypothetical protein
MDLPRSRTLLVRPPSSWRNTRLTPIFIDSLSGHKWWKNCLRPPSYEKPAAGCLYTLSSHRWVSTIVSHHAHHADFPHPRNGWNDSRSSTPSFRNDAAPRPPAPDRGSRSGHVTPDRGGSRWGGDRPHSAGGWNAHQKEPRGGGGSTPFGYGTWKDGIHVVGGRNMPMEKELFGDPDDPSKQHTGINFEKYDDIPVEATGAGVPDPITTFATSPLDPVLLENITSARYSTPTPVQKYSVPIVAAGRDLMACAQVRSFTFPVVPHHSTLNTSDWLRQNRRFPLPHPFCFLLPGSPSSPR